MTERISTPTEPLIIEPRFRYERMVSRIVAARGEWVCIDPAELQVRTTALSNPSFCRRGACAV